MSRTMDQRTTTDLRGTALRAAVADDKAQEDRRRAKRLADQASYRAHVEKAASAALKTRVYATDVELLVNVAGDGLRVATDDDESYSISFATFTLDGLTFRAKVETYRQDNVETKLSVLIDPLVMHDSRDTGWARFYSLADLGRILRKADES